MKRTDTWNSWKKEAYVEHKVGIKLRLIMIISSDQLDWEDSIRYGSFDEIKLRLQFFQNCFISGACNAGKIVLNRKTEEKSLIATKENEEVFFS